MQCSSSSPELTALDSRNFLLREQTLGSKIGSELNEKFIFRNLPMDVKGVIDQKVVDEQTVRFCRRLSSIQPTNRMNPKVFFGKML